MADYKVIFRSDGTTNGEHRLLWSPKSPALLTAVQVSRNTQTSTAFLQVKIRNVSDETIRSVGCSATLFYSDGTNEVVEFEDLDVDLEQAAEKPLKAQQLSRGDVEAADVILTRVTTDDLKWRAEKDPIDVPKPDPLDFSERAMRRRHQLLSRSGADGRAWNSSVIDSENWWVCACGQLNVGRTACCECGSDKGLLMSTEDEAELLASADERDDAIYQKAVSLSEHAGNAKAMSQAAELFRQIPGWKDADKRLVACNEAVSAKKARLMRRIAIAAVSLAAVALLVAIFVVPMVKYNYVRSHLNREDETTYRYLSELKESGYKDSAELYSELFDWRFEFVLSTDKEALASGGTTLDWVEKKSFGSGENCSVLARAISGPPNQEKTLTLHSQRLSKRTSSNGEIKWGKGDPTSTSLTLASNSTDAVGKTINSQGIDRLDVWITDPDTGKVLFEGESYKEN